MSGEGRTWGLDHHLRYRCIVFHKLILYSSCFERIGRFCKLIHLSVVADQNRNSYWLGASDVSGSWVWEDGTPVKMGTPFWGDSPSGVRISFTGCTYTRIYIIRNCFVYKCLAILPQKQYPLYRAAGPEGSSCAVIFANDHLLMFNADCTNYKNAIICEADPISPAEAWRTCTAEMRECLADITN